MPDVLVLYPGRPEERQALVRTHRAQLDALGVRLVLADDGVVASDRDCFADVIPLPPPERVEEAWEVLRRALSARPVDASFAQSEDAVLLGALAAREFGLPGLSPEAALRTVSKVHTRRALAAAGVAQPRFALAASAADVARFARDSGHPVVLKAGASVRSRLVTLVEHPEDVQPAVERVLAGLPCSEDVERVRSFARAARTELGYDPLRQFLVEEFAPGAPVETDGLVVGSTPLCFGVIEQVLTPPPRFYLEGYLLPADRPAPELAAIERASADAIAAVGLADAGYAIELRWDGARARVIEVNGRLGWDEGFGELFAAVLGAAPMLLALQLALGIAPRARRDPAARAAIAYRSCFQEGVVRSVPDAGAVARAALGGLRVEVTARAGRRLHAPPHPDVEPHLAFALARDARSSRAAYERARAALGGLAFEIAPAG